MELEILTHTKRRDFRNCPRYYLHRHIQHLSLRAQKRGRRRGTIFGDLLLSVHETNQMSPELELTSSFPTLLAFCQHGAEHLYDEIRESGSIDGNELADLDVEEVKLYVMAAMYVDYYGIDNRREVEFDLPLRNPRTGRTSRAFRIGGKIDGISKIEIGADGVNIATIIEDKFVQSIQPAMIRRLPLDDQSSEYVDAFLSKGWNAKVLYRHTRFPGKNPLPPKEFKTKDNYPGETLDEFAVRLIDDVEQNPESYFHQEDLFFPHVHLDDYRRGRWGTAQHIIQARKYAGTQREQEAFPMNPTRCWEYGGCEFIPLCTKQEGAIDLYELVEDNPELNHGKDDEAVTATYGTGT